MMADDYVKESERPGHETQEARELYWEGLLDHIGGDLRVRPGFYAFHSIYILFQTKLYSAAYLFEVIH